MGSTEFRDLVPTANKDLFVDSSNRLVHREVGLIGLDARFPLTMPDGTRLRVFHGAPKVAFTIGLVSQESFGADDAAKIFKIFSSLTKASNPYGAALAGAEIGIQIIGMIVSALQEAEPTLAEIDQKLNDLMVGVGAVDYLNLLRAMADMRANSVSIVQTLSALGGTIAASSDLNWYQTQLIQRDADLQTHINALLDPSAAYFRRVYVEKHIEGDGNWMFAIPDRPNDAQGTTFDYTMALPTLMELIATRLTMMKLVVPDFVERRTFSVEIDSWGRRIIQLASQMGNHVKTTPLTSYAVQSARRQTDGNQKLGSFRQWDQHCFVNPPRSIAPIGAADISTGISRIEWQYQQFDEYYLAQGNLHGGDAGYWPPSIGPDWYEPPVQATGLPDLMKSYASYALEADQRAKDIGQEIYARIGGDDVNTFGWRMMQLAHPNAPI